jgi:tripartite-type tricarboxylate transporter receptor subunit TctC
MSIFLNIPFAADDYPSRPIELVVGYPPGGASDIISRIVVEGANRYLEGNKGKIYVINKPGAGAIVGMTYVVKSKPDGYTIGNIHVGNTTLATLFPEITPYTMDDIEPICCFTNSIFGLYVREDSQIKSFEDLIKFATEHPGSVSCAIAGKESLDNVYLELIKIEKKIDIRGIPFKGSGPQVSALLGGHVDLTIANNTAAAPHVEANKLRALLVFHKERIKELPYVPVPTEKGMPEFPTIVLGLGGPAGIPRDRFKKLCDIFDKAMHDPELITRIEKTRDHILYLNGEQLKKNLYKDLGLIQRVKDRLK